MTYDFHALWRLEPEALGEPGKRAFRLVAENDGGRAILWAEKQHLQGLALAIHQLLSATAGVGEAASEPRRGALAAVRMTLIMRTDRFELGFDPPSDSFVLQAHDQEAPGNAPHVFSCHPTRGQLQALAENVETLAAAGRPRCPVCGQILEPGTQHHHPQGQLEAGS
jgi:uncharacterized repeat protein (TIGR03847 family)